LNVQNDLRHALALSQLYGSLAALYRSNGQSSRGKQLSDVRLELWRHWDAKLPDNGFVRRQFEATHIH
jgi:hypothetical protein